MADLAITAAMAISGPAAADAFRNFEALCVETKARPAVALARAGRDGWHGAVSTSNACGVTFEGVSYGSILPQGAKWAAAPPLSQEVRGTIFVFSDVGGRHGPVSSAELDKATPDLVRTKRITQFDVHNLSRGSALEVVVPVR